MALPVGVGGTTRSAPARAVPASPVKATGPAAPARSGSDIFGRLAASMASSRAPVVPYKAQTPVQRGVNAVRDPAFYGGYRAADAMRQFLGIPWSDPNAGHAPHLGFGAGPSGGIFQSDAPKQPDSLPRRVPMGDAPHWTTMMLIPNAMVPRGVRGRANFQRSHGIRALNAAPPTQAVI